MRIRHLLILGMFLCSLSNGKNINIASGIYLNETLQTTIKSAYYGGAIADPTRGSSYRLRLCETSFEDVNQVKKVYLSGFKYKNTSYTLPGQFIDRIVIGDLEIPLNQGKYENGESSVKSVEFISFDTQTNETVNIHIRIKKQDGKRLDIIYKGKIMYDGRY